MRKIAANIIFPITSEPVKNGYLLIDDDNTLIKVVDTQGEINEIAGLEYYSGILVPGLLFASDDNNANPVFLDQLQNDYKSEHGKAARYLWSRGVEAVPENFSFEKSFTWNIHELPKNFHEQLKQFTIKNATKLGLQKIMGCFEPGKQPGVLLISGYDFENKCLGADAKVLRLV